MNRVPRPVLDRRRAGVLLHPSSLPSGTLGEDADRFLDWLTTAGFSAWQMLPVGPAGEHGSPYSATSAFAGSESLLPAAARVAAVDRSGFARFRERESGWLEDYARFTAIRQAQAGQPWWHWPEALRHRDRRALRRFAREHAAALEGCRSAQYRFARHWRHLRARANERGVWLIGDLPMFVVGDSGDAWARPELFQLDAHDRPRRVAGVPPDAFSASGQCWNNPVYDWDALAAEGFDWWLRRVRLALERFDRVRWDHFRGLVATWEIPVGPDGEAMPATAGRWQSVPGRALLERLRVTFGALPLIAENLGFITPEVERLRLDFGLPGLHVLQFAFDGTPDNPHLPARHETQGVACTGTHDNDTALGWWQALDEAGRARVRALLGEESPSMPDALIELALQSRCALAMIPLQDLLRLGSVARMNRPGVAADQWRWRFDFAQLTPAVAMHWRSRLERAGRC